MKKTIAAIAVLVFVFSTLLISCQQQETAQQQTPGYGEKAPGYGQETPGYGEKAPGYGQETPGYGEKAPGYGQQAPAEGGN